MPLSTLSPLPKLRTRSRIWHFKFFEFIGNEFDVSQDHAIRGDAPCFDRLWDAGDSSRCRGPAIWEEGEYAVHLLHNYDPAGTFILLHGSCPCGFYTESGQCWIAPSHRGQHLSTQLILAAVDFFGGRPFVEDVYGFTEAGYAAHRAAYRWGIESACEHGLISRRLRESLLLTCPA